MMMIIKFLATFLGCQLRHYIGQRISYIATASRHMKKPYTCVRAVIWSFPLDAIQRVIAFGGVTRLMTSSSSRWKSSFEKKARKKMSHPNSTIGGTKISFSGTVFQGGSNGEGFRSLSHRWRELCSKKWYFGPKLDIWKQITPVPTDEGG